MRTPRTIRAPFAAPSVRLLLALGVVALVTAGVVPSGSAALAPVQLSEIRIDQPSVDNDEYVELAGAAGESLDTVTFLVIGDGVGTGSGVIENVTPLTGTTIPSSGYFVIAKATFTLGVADLVADLTLENDDNLTALLVTGFSGANGDDLDTNDDGVLDTTPWTSLVDLIAIIEEANPPAGTEYHYGPPGVGPDGTSAPQHVYRCDEWVVGAADPLTGDDSPGAANACDQTPPTDPSVTSPSHTPGVPSPDTTVDVVFTGATDALSGVDGFSFHWDTGPTSVPDTVKDAEETAVGTTSPSLPAGSHWFHLRTRDNAGHWTSTVHAGPFSIVGPALTLATKITKRGDIKVTGTLSPPHPGHPVVLTLFKKKGGFKQVKRRTVTLSSASTFRTKLPGPAATRCRVTAEWSGDGDTLPGSATRTFRC